MRLWKTTAICSTTVLLAGLSAAPATAAPAEGGGPVAAALAPAHDLSALLTGPARDLETPGYRLVPVEERTVEYRVVDPAATPAPKRTLTFTNPPQAPSAAYLEVRYQQGNGDSFKEVSPLLRPGGPAWQTTLQGDDREVDLQVKDASGAVLAERSYPGEMPAGNPSVAWFYQSVFDLPGYTFTWWRPGGAAVRPRREGSPRGAAVPRRLTPRRGRPATSHPAAPTTSRPGGARRRWSWRSRAAPGAAAR